MAIVATLAGGMLGFLSAMAALLVFDASWLLAFGLWGGGGLLIALTVLLLALSPREKPREALVSEAA